VTAVGTTIAVVLLFYTNTWTKEDEIIRGWRKFVVRNITFTPHEIWLECPSQEERDGLSR
jgi:hypothetical protein